MSTRTSYVRAPEGPHKHQLASETATVRNLAIGLLLLARSENMAAVTRYLNRHVERPLRLLGLA
jgi:hypothetical protein